MPTREKRKIKSNTTNKIEEDKLFQCAQMEVQPSKQTPIKKYGSKINLVSIQSFESSDSTITTKVLTRLNFYF